MIKLYWAPASRAFRALWLLEELGEPYERIHVNIRAGEQGNADYRAVNPMGKVPAIMDGDVAVAESGAIFTYLADRYPKAGLAPAIDDPARGRYLQWLFFSSGVIEGAYLEKYAKISVPSGAVAWGSFDKVMRVLNAQVAKGPWLLGERFTAADVLIGADLHFGVELFKVISGQPEIEAYIARCKARPAFRRALEIDAAAMA